MDNFRAVAFLDTGRWRVRCLERDIAASAVTLEDAKRHLLHVIDADREAGIEMHGEPFGGIDAAPVEFHGLWEGGEASTRISSKTATVDIRIVTMPWKAAPAPRPGEGGTER